MFLTSLPSCPDVVKCICLFSEKCPTHLSDGHLIPVSPSKHRDRLSHLGKVLTIQMWIPKFSLQDPWNPSTSRQKHAGSWGSAASQPKLVCEPSASERPCLKKIQGGQFLRNNTRLSLDLHMHTHTHMHLHLYICVHVCVHSYNPPPQKPLTLFLQCLLSQNQPQMKTSHVHLLHCPTIVTVPLSSYYQQPTSWWSTFSWVSSMS